jgi:hypothetical protein
VAEEEDYLLRIEEGETREDAIVKWWKQNGLDHLEAQMKRKETYAAQKLAMSFILARVDCEGNRLPRVALEPPSKEQQSTLEGEAPSDPPAD